MQASTGQFATVVAGASMTVEHSVSLTLPPTAGLSRINLCTDPSFEGSTTLWLAGGGPLPTLALSSARAFAGAKSLLITWGTGLVGIPGAYYHLVTIPGLTYTVSGYVWVPTGGIAVQLGSGSVTSGPSTLTNQWQRLSLTFTATSTSELIALAPFGSPTSGQQVFFDAVLIEQGATLGSYFDGATTDASWTGDPNRSASQLRTNPYQDVTLAAESISVDRQLVTDMPDGTRLITGYPAASAQVTLSGYVDQTPGASKSIAWLLNPAEPTSPMYRSDALGAPIIIQAGLYVGGAAAPELFTIFTGTVDDYTCDMEAGTVTLTCLDPRTKLTSAPPLPAGVFSSDVVADTYLAGAKGQLLTPAWVLYQMCENLGLYASPPPRTNVAFRQTNHGAAWPEIPWPAAYTVASLTGTDWTAGKFAAQVPVNSFTQFYNSPPAGNPNGVIPGNIGASGNAWFFECWVKPDSSTAATVSPNTALHLTLNNTAGSPGVELEMGAVAASIGAALTPYAFVFLLPSSATTQVTSSTTIPNDGAWHYYAAHFRWVDTTHFTVTFYVDGTSNTQNGTLSAAATANIGPLTALVQHLVPTESIQVTNELAPALSNNAFVASQMVDIDPSLNQLTTIPDLTGQDAWGTIQQIAQAEGAIAGFDELGVFRFVNRESLRQQTDQRTITPKYSLKSLDQEMGLSFVRNHIQVPVNLLQVQAPGTVWDTGSTVHTVGANSTSVLYVTTDNPVADVDTVGEVMPSGGGVAGLSYYRACTAPNGHGNTRTNLTMLVTQTGPSSLTIQVINPNPQPVWLVSPTDAAFPSGSIGTPILRVGGVNITPIATPPVEGGNAAAGSIVADEQWPPLQPDGTGGAASNPRGEQLLVLSANPFVQDGDSAQAYGSDLLIDLSRPRPLWRRTAIVTDPRLQLGDRVLIQDPDTTMVDGSALIVGSHVTVSRTDWNQTLDLRSVGAPGSWILGVAGKSEMSQTTYV